VQRGLRQKLLETYPGFEPYIEEIMPKKASLEAVKLYVSPPNTILHHPTPPPISYKENN
jgi:PUA domain protein